MRRSLGCPQCRVGVPPWELLRFLRFHSIDCPHCRALLQLDNRGRAALFLGYLACIPLGIVLHALFGYEVAVPAAVLAGFVFSCVAASVRGTLQNSAETREG